MALLLFLGFTAVTQYQFNRVSEKNVELAQKERDSTSLLLYQNSLTLRHLCLHSETTNGTGSYLFLSIADMLDDVSNDPKLTEQFRANIQTLLVSDATNCPEVPTSTP